MLITDPLPLLRCIGSLCHPARREVLTQSRGYDCGGVTVSQNPAALFQENCTRLFRPCFHFLSRTNIHGQLSGSKALTRDQSRTPLWLQTDSDGTASVLTRHIINLSFSTQVVRNCKAKGEFVAIRAELEMASTGSAQSQVSFMLFLQRKYKLTGIVVVMLESHPHWRGKVADSFTLKIEKMPQNLG